MVRAIDETVCYTGTDGPRYRGLRMRADEYSNLSEDGYRYELVDGVIQLSPSATPLHQLVAAEIVSQLAACNRRRKVGTFLFEVDVQIRKRPDGRDLVYRPDIVFYCTGRLPRVPKRLTLVPDLVVEIISPDSRRYDQETKKNDYERAGVKEYWLIDPERGEMSFFRLLNRRFVAMPPTRTKLKSEAVPGFSLNLTELRELFPGT